MAPHPPNSWTALLQALHSAMIDELVERHPEPKPELGLPARKNSWEMPCPLDLGTEVLIVGVEIGEQRGMVSLVLSLTAQKKLGCTAHRLWEQLLGRAQVDFVRKGIQPQTGISQVFNYQGTQDTKIDLPSNFNEPTRLIWTPFRLAGEAIFLGIGLA
ncbi:hypothetical protein WDW86_21890 [Bdellovibrionota bacterium FG-2]